MPSLPRPPSAAPPRPRARLTVTRLVAAVTLSLIATFVLAAPAHAADRVITITAAGVSPKTLTVAAGDTVTFRNDDGDFSYRAVSTSGNWAFDSGPIGLLPGRSYTVPDAITDSGTYSYRVAEDAPFNGTVVLPRPPGASPAATRAPSPRATPAASPTTAPEGSPSAAPSPTGGSGTTQVPGGFGSLEVPASPPGEGQAPPPALAPPLLGDAQSPVPAPATAPEPSPAATGAPAVAGDLAGARTSRGVGLPAALAVVAAAGVASLLLRLLLAEPVRRRPEVATD